MGFFLCCGLMLNDLPSVPPSISGFSESGFSMSTMPTSVALIHLRASILSRPQTTMPNCM